MPGETKFRNDVETLVRAAHEHGGEVRIRQNSGTEYSVRVYAYNREKLAHGVGATFDEALQDAVKNLIEGL